MFVQYLEGMDMAKCPILIATLDEFFERAGSVVVVSGTIVTGGVEDADIEPAGSGSWIPGSEICRDCPGREALPVQNDLEIGELETLNLMVVECSDCLRWSDGLGNDAFGVMVPTNQEDRNAALSRRDIWL
jgi:hypothetical protein